MAPVGGIAVVAAAVAGKYDKLTIKYKIRYGSDGRYNHYERVTTFYGDGKYIKAFTDRGKRY
ncbi:hypothetical protein H477_5911 [[Clostridium] sordellii ATCC 9714]|nr:hypothetical protein H477_5911 [[Clostridium] sordellii ATCC 9714] [Paeniclostridium sordellii ATCC 9714]